MTLALDPVLTHLNQGLDSSVERWKDLLRIPSIGADPAYDHETRRAASWMVDALTSIGFEASLRDTPGQPMVVAHHPGPQNGQTAPHVLYYGHYDVQPVVPLELWDSPPFEPTIVEAEHGPRMVARGAVDDKGQVMTWIEAMRAWQEVHGTLPIKVTAFLEGEEESGSPSLEPFVRDHRGELTADFCVVSDTGMWDIDTPALATMLRGLVYTEVVLRGPSHDLHSGLYGGSVPNALNVLIRILGGLHDDDGRVQVPGYYDDVAELSEEERSQHAALPFDEAGFFRSVGLSEGTGETGRTVLERKWTRPTCDINGAWGGYTGAGSKTVIPAEARAKVSFRLVSDQDPARVVKGFQKFIADRTPANCSSEVIVLSASAALRIPTDAPYVQAAGRALKRTFGRPPVMVGMGGSIPAVEVIKRILGLDSLLMGFGLTDDRVHSPNEKFELRCFEQGARSHAALLAELAGM